MAREERQHADVPFAIVLEGQKGHFLRDGLPGLLRVVLRGSPVVLVGAGRQQRTVVGVDVRIAIAQRDGTGSQIFRGLLDSVRDADADDVVGLVVVPGDTVDEVIERIPGRVGRRGMAMGGSEHGVLLVVLGEAALRELFQDTGFYALGHVDEFRRHIDLGLAVRLHDEGAGVQSGQETLHEVAERVVTGRDVRDGSGDVPFADTDSDAPALRVRGKRRAEDRDNHDQREQQCDSHVPKSFHSHFLSFSPNNKKARIQGNRFRVWRLSLTEIIQVLSTCFPLHFTFNHNLSS